MVTTGRDNLDKSIEKYAARTMVIAKNSMRKAPKKPKSRFGNQQAYSKRSRKFGQTFWRKGMYSRPGEPPFYHESAQQTARKKQGVKPSRTLRNIMYSKVADGKYIVGPKIFKGTRYSIPDLHEFGGTVRPEGGDFAYWTPLGVKRRKTPKSATYPKRPFMRPALIKAKYDKKGQGRSFVDRQNSIGGMTPTKRAS